MGHCGGGPGPNSFGNGLPIPEDPEHDIFLALVNWVEFGTAPDQIIATKYVNDNPANGIAFTRPLCVFPKIAKYKGSGNAADATNWACVNEIVNDTTEDADEVLRDRGDGDHDDNPGDHDSDSQRNRLGAAPLASEAAPTFSPSCSRSCPSADGIWRA